MHELLIHRNGRVYTYSEMLLLQEQMRAVVAAGRKKRKDKYAKLEPNFNQGKQITPSITNRET